MADKNVRTPFGLASDSFGNGPNNGAVKPVQFSGDTPPTSDIFGKQRTSSPTIEGQPEASKISGQGAANAYQFYNPNIPTKTPVAPFNDALNQQSDVVHGKDTVMDQLQRSALSTQRAAQGSESQALSQQTAQADLSTTQKATIGAMQDRTQAGAESQLLSDLAVQRGDRQQQASQTLASQALQAHELDSIIANRESNTLAQNLMNFREEMSYIDLTADGGMASAEKIFTATMGDSPDMKQYWNNLDFTDVQNQQFNTKENQSMAQLSTHLITKGADAFMTGTEWVNNDGQVVAEGTAGATQRGTGFNFFNPSGDFIDPAMKTDGLNAFFFAMGGGIPGAETIGSSAELISAWNNDELSAETKDSVMTYLNETADDAVLSENSLSYKNGVSNLNFLWSAGQIDKDDYDTTLAGLNELAKLDLAGGVTFTVDDKTGDVTIKDSSGNAVFEGGKTQTITGDIMIGDTAMDLDTDAVVVTNVPSNSSLIEGEDVNGFTLNDDGSIKTTDGETLYNVDGKWYNGNDFKTNQEFVNENKGITLDDPVTDFDYDSPKSGDLGEWAGVDHNLTDKESESFVSFLKEGGFKDILRSDLDLILENPKMIELLKESVPNGIVQETRIRKGATKSSKRADFGWGVLNKKGDPFIMNDGRIVEVVTTPYDKRFNSQNYGQEAVLRDLETGETFTISARSQFD
jgi:hypothetical protein